MSLSMKDLPLTPSDNYEEMREAVLEDFRKKVRNFPFEGLLEWCEYLNKTVGELSQNVIDDGVVDHLKSLSVVIRNEILRRYEVLRVLVNGNFYRE